MTITLYHCKGTRSLRPLWTLAELGLEYELKTLPFPPRVQCKNFLGINPLGTVPYLIDGEMRMTESAAMCQYLVERYGPTPLAVSSDELDYGFYLNWLHHGEATLTFPLTICFRYSSLEPKDRRLPQAVKDYKRFYLGRLKLLKAALEDRDYLCGGRFTVADISVGYSLLAGYQEDFTPTILSYLNRLTCRPAYQAVKDLTE